MEEKFNRLRREADEDIVFADKKRVLFDEKVQKMFEQVYAKVAEE